MIEWKKFECREPCNLPEGHRLMPDWHVYEDTDPESAACKFGHDCLDSDPDYAEGLEVEVKGFGVYEVGFEWDPTAYARKVSE